MTRATACLGALVLGLSAAHPFPAAAQTTPRDTIVCVQTAGGRPGRPMPRRIVGPSVPCAPGEERMRVVVATTTPLIGNSPVTAPGGRRTQTEVLALPAPVPSTAAVLVETTVVLDNHAAPTAVQGGGEAAAVTCTTTIDGQPAGGTVELRVVQPTGTGGRQDGPPIGDEALDPAPSQLPPGSSGDVIGSTLRRFRRASVGTHRLAVVCEEGGLRTPLRGEVTLVVLQSEL